MENMEEKKLILGLIIVNENKAGENIETKLFGRNFFMLSPNLGLGKDIAAYCIMDGKICDYLSVIQKSSSNPFKTSLVRISSKNKEQLQQLMSNEMVDANGKSNCIPMECEKYEVKENISENGYKDGYYYIDITKPVYIDGNSWINMVILNTTSLRIEFYGK